MSDQQEKQPIGASADGKRNAFYVACDVMKHARPYAVCLNLCSNRKDGRLSAVYSECSAAIGKKECPALKMRKEEIDAGYAIYFRERIKTEAGFVERAKQFVTGVVAAVVPATAAKPALVASKKARGIIDKIDDTGYSEVIKKTPTVAPPPKIEIREGESLLDMARRLMAK